MRPTLLANDIDAAFNRVHHDKLAEIMTKAGFPKYLVSWIHGFCTNRTLSFHFNGEDETPKTFESGLPQGSPLSPILFVVYSAPAIQPSQSKLQIDSIYVDDDPVLQGATSPQKASLLLQT